eukprot:scaffold92447_cov60-Phaeocystis_antarctica.AAC.3
MRVRARARARAKTRVRGGEVVHHILVGASLLQLGLEGAHLLAQPRRLGSPAPRRAAHSPSPVRGVGRCREREAAREAARGAVAGRGGAGLGRSMAGWGRCGGGAVAVRSRCGNGCAPHYHPAWSRPPRRSSSLAGLALCLPPPRSVGAVSWRSPLGA